jgi:septum formation protein
VVSGLDEDEVVRGISQPSPQKIVECLADAKASDASKNVHDADALVLGADTIVVLNGEVLGKPSDKQDAIRMLMKLSGQTHQVRTGVALIRVQNGEIVQKLVRSDVTNVTFSPFDHARAQAYVSTGEPMDKAGAYGIQAIGALLIPKIDGDYFNVVGLPLFLLGQMLEEFGWKIL